MASRVTSVLAAGIVVMAAPAQTPPQTNVAPPWPGLRPDTTRALRGYMKKQLTDHPGTMASTCSIPLVKVPLPKEVEPMPTMRPSAGPELDRMFVPLPAPPCKEEKR
jgi:hypothetical protein